VVRISGGLDLPYPEPTSVGATAIGKANRRVDSKPELRLRSELHRAGLRFRKDHLVRAGSARARVDVCFTRAKVAVFVDGCFWHMCPQHFAMPKSNTSYWGPKLEGNVVRDRRIDRALGEHGWTVIRVWEHADAQGAASEIAAVLRSNRVPIAPAE